MKSFRVVCALEGEWFQPVCKRIVTSVQYQFIYSRNGSFEHTLMSTGYFVIKAIFFLADTIAIGCVNTSKLHLHLECKYVIYTFFLYSTYSYGMGGI